MQVLRALPFLALASCLQLGPDAADGGAGGSTGLAGSTAVSGSVTTGAKCSTNPASGISLCKVMNACPSVVVDGDIYPDCGFRVPSAGIDLECVCGDFLCPVGTALTCSDAQSLLQGQSELLVCIQTSESRCAPLVSQSAPSTCDTTCREGCVGDPTCVTQCGC